MIRIVVFVTGILFLSLVVSAQSPYELGAEYIKAFGQGYKGDMVGLRYERYPNKGSWSAGITYNFSSKSSYSEYKGFGINAGYRYGFGLQSDGSNIFAGLRVFLSFQSYAGKSNDYSMALTPMAEMGYHKVLGRHWFTSPMAGYGYTIKLSKDYNSLAEDEDGRIYAGLSLGYRF